MQTFIDNDLVRLLRQATPLLLQVLDGLRSGEFDVVLAWHTDRPHRNLSELEEFIDVCDCGAVKIATVQAGDLDLATPSGRMVARMLGSAAGYESEHKADRNRRKALESADAGKVGGGTRPYGYNADWRTLFAPEAKSSATAPPAYSPERRSTRSCAGSRRRDHHHDGRRLAHRQSAPHAVLRPDQPPA